MPDFPSLPSGRRVIRRIVEPGARYYLLAATFFVVVFGIIPISIYAYSDDDWGFPFPYMLRIAALGVVLCLGAWLIIRLLCLLGRTPAIALACLLFCLGLFALLAHVYAPISIGPLDGSEIESDEPALYTAIEAGLALLATLILVQLLRGRGTAMAAIFSALLLVMTFGYGGVLLVTREGHALHAQKPTKAAPGLQGNVYQIVLDSMRTDVFLRALEQTGLAPEFTGFELFKNNVSNYFTTIHSSASYFTGTIYRGGPWKRWIWRWHRHGIIPALADRGYKIWMYSPFPNWKIRSVDRFWYNFDILEREQGIVATVGFHGLIQIWLLSLAPNPLTNEALPLAAAWCDRIFYLLTGQTEPVSVSELHPVAGVAMLRRLLREEDLRAANGQYVYAHAALPHTPFVFDPECRYVGQRKTRAQPPTGEVYVEQAECTIRLLTAFLQRLRELGRYDTATVVVHADTGHGVGRVGATPSTAGRSTLGVADSALLNGVEALLMIKRPHADAPFRTSTAPTQLVDLFPTVLDILDIDLPYAPDGKSVYALDPGEPRDIRFEIDPANKYRHNFMEVRIDDPTDLEGSSLTVIGPASDGASAGAGPRK